MPELSDRVGEVIEASTTEFVTECYELYELPPLGSLVSVLVVGHSNGQTVYQYLPPKPAHIHSFVYLCPSERVKEFSRSFDFLNLLLNTSLPVSVEELVAATLRQMSRAHEDKQAFLKAAGRELAVLLSSEFNRLRAILGRITPA